MGESIDPAGQCPCCEYFSIGAGADGAWDICPVCWWENGGDGPNHMTLAEAKANFARLGAISERGLQFLDPDRLDKYRAG